MRLACTEALVPGERLQSKMLWLEQKGFQGIEISGYDIGIRISEMLDLLPSSSVKISAMHSGNGRMLVSSDMAVTAQAKHDMEGLLKYCSILNCPGLVIALSRGSHHAYSEVFNPQPVTEVDLEQTAEVLSDLAVTAEEYGVNLYLEPVNRYETDCFHTLDEVAKLCEVIGRDNVQLAPNTFHMNIEERSISVSLARHASRIGYIRMSDSNRGLPGEGHLAFQDIMLTLRQIGYNGYILMDAGKSNEAGLLQAKGQLSWLKG